MEEIIIGGVYYSIYNDEQIVRVDKVLVDRVCYFMLSGNAFYNGKNLVAGIAPFDAYYRYSLKLTNLYNIKDIIE